MTHSATHGPAVARHVPLVLALVLAAGSPRMAPAAATSGGGPVPGSICVTPEQREAIRLALLAHPRPTPEAIGVSPLFSDPMSGGGMNSPRKTVTNYVDLDGAPSTIRDWNCGSVTYDAHAGVDIEITDFFEMDEGIPVLCAAPGTVIITHDGEFDRQTALNPTATANAVVVQHADGSTAYYWHMRKGSVRVSVGNVVATNDTLGLAGSSGNSSGPHLHFEVHDGPFVEPFQGPCQPQPSRWISQSPYVLLLPAEIMRNGVTTLPANWPTILEYPPSKSHVVAGKTIYSWIRARNFTVSDVLTWKFYVNDLLFVQHSFSPSGTYPSSWWFVQLTPPLGNYGNWRVDIQRNGVVMAQQFFIYDTDPNRAPILPDRLMTLPTTWTWTDEFRGYDPDGAIFRYEVLTPPRRGTLTTFGGRNRMFTYAPNAGFVGRDTIIVRAVDDENVAGAAAIYAFNVVSSVDVEDVPPAAVKLAGFAPNPVSGSGEIAYTLAVPARVTVDLYDLAGARVRRLVNGTHDAGRHSATWDTRDDNGRSVAPGVYFLRVSDGHDAATRRLVVAR